VLALIDKKLLPVVRVQVAWTRDDNFQPPLTVGEYTFTPNLEISVQHNETTDTWCLLIANVSHVDDGLYECSILDVHEAISYDVYLQTTGT